MNDKRYSIEGLAVEVFHNFCPTFTQSVGIVLVISKFLTCILLQHAVLTIQGSKCILDVR